MRSVVVSEFLPRARWATHSAMQRNKTICGLSNAVVLVEAGLDGGTFDAGETARKFRVPLFVLDFGVTSESTTGNAYFLKRGAPALRVDAKGGADLRPVLATLDAPEHPDEQQPRLFG